MWESNYKHSSPPAGYVWAALLCTLFTEYSSSKESELSSELICWTILFFFFRNLKYKALKNGIKPASPTMDKNQSSSPSSLWIIAISIAIPSAYKTENRFIEAFPVLTPLLLMVQRYLQPGVMPVIAVSRQRQQDVHQERKITLISLFILIASVMRDFRRAIPSIVPTIALLLVYIAFIPGRNKSFSIIPFIATENSIISLSKRVIFILFFGLSLETSVFGFHSSRLAAAITSGVGKALSWIFLIHTAQKTSWSVVAAIRTFGIFNTIDLSMPSSQITTTFCIMSSFLAAGQIIQMLPKQMKYRTAIWILPILTIIPYLKTTAAITSIKSANRLSFDSFQDHPVEIIINKAKNDFEISQQKQSQSYLAAYNEYQHRYGIEPPPGFKEWYEFATFHHSPIIDEFDTISHGILPLLKLSGKEILGATKALQDHSNGEIWDCTFSAQGETYCTNPHRSFDRHIQLLFNTLLGDLKLDIPNVRFLVNHLDEPRALLPPVSRETGSHYDLRLNLTDLSHQSTYDAITRWCASQNQGRDRGGKNSIQTFGLPFITDPKSAMDLCQHPEYTKQHGLLISPTSFRLIEGPVPVLSTGSLSTMSDILYPSPAYMEPEFLYVDQNDVEWDKKYNKLYWAGSTTGGFALDDKWQNYHRQRFITFAQNLDKQEYYYLQKKGNNIERMKIPLIDKKLFDTFFTKIFQCGRKSCRDQRLFFNTKSWAHKDEAFKSKLVFDMDGNGISGRYYKLLASRSTPLKQTLLREWHDDRLVPWVHYVPVSQSMDELPELILYLTSTHSGQKRAKEIADQGRKWFRKAFRDIDFTIYTYRLLLELARLQDPARPAMEFSALEV